LPHTDFPHMLYVTDGGPARVSRAARHLARQVQQRPQPEHQRHSLSGLHQVGYGLVVMVSR